MLVIEGEKVPFMRLFDPTPAQDVIGSFADARAAALAVRHLEGHGLADRIRVRPAALDILAHGLEHVPDHLDRTRIAMVALTAGSIPMVVNRSLRAATLGVVVAALVAALVAVFESARLALRRRRQVRASGVVRACRFDIVCDDDVATARHLLASWWDPEARPVPTPRRQRLTRSRQVDLAA